MLLPELQREPCRGVRSGSPRVLNALSFAFGSRSVSPSHSSFPPALDNPQPLLTLFLVLLPHSGMAHGPWSLSFLPHGPAVPAPSPATLTAEPLTLLPFPLSGSSAVSPSCAPATENFADRTVPLGDAAGRYTEVVTEVSLLYLPTKKK